MGIFADLKGTTENIFRIGTHALKAITGGLAARNSADSSDEKLQASQFEATGNTGLIINSDAAETGADYKITLARPSSGMTASYVLTLPVDGGSASQVLSTDGSGVLSWVSAGSTSACLTVDTTSLAFNSSDTLSLFTLPANAVVHQVEVVIDTPWDTAATVTVGISGNTAKYMAATANNLQGTAKDRYRSNPGEAASGSTEALIATYSAASSTVGTARILVTYSVPA
jgi:hypothetical protein